MVDSVPIQPNDPWWALTAVNCGDVGAGLGGTGLGAPPGAAASGASVAGAAGSRSPPAPLVTVGGITDGRASEVSVDPDPAVEDDVPLLLRLPEPESVES
jgi:hypothetical protein